MTERHPYELKMIPAREINVNPTYQRGVQTDMVRHIVNNFDYHQVNPVKVVFRDGEYWAFDGQQTTTALITMFGKEYLVPCMIYYDVLSWDAEATIYEMINSKKARKAVKAADLWKSRLSREDVTATEIKAILESNGLTLGGKGHGSVRCLETLDWIWDKYGADVFREVIENVAQAWHCEVESLQTPMLKGMAIFVAQFKDQYNRKKLVNALGKKHSALILKDGKSRIEAGNKKYADAIRGVYNNAARGDNRLPPIK